MSNCMTVTGGDRIRITRVDGCGRPVYGECNAVVTKGIVDFTLTPNADDADPKEQTNFGGELCYSEPQCSQITDWDVKMTWCGINFTAFQMMNPTYKIVHNDAGDIIGYYASNELDCSKGYAIEVWLKLGGDVGDACTGDAGTGDGLWGYLIIPWATGGAPEELTIGGDDAITWGTNGKIKTGGRWGLGPYDVILDSNGIPSPLPEVIDGNRPFGLLETQMQPPEEDCDCVEVERPVPPEADVTIYGQPNQDPRMTVNVRADNHGFGDVIVNFGDGSDEVTAADLKAAQHTYAADGTYTVTVCDALDRDICTSRDITIPLPDDNPVMDISCDPTRPLTAQIEVTVPQQAATGNVTINWGDGSAEETATADESGYLAATHIYRRGSRYTVTVRRTDNRLFRARRSILLPCSGDLKPRIQSVKGTESDTQVAYTFQISGAANGTGKITIEANPAADVEISNNRGTFPYTFDKAENTRQAQISFVDSQGNASDPVNIQIPAAVTTGPAAPANLSVPTTTDTTATLTWTES